MSKSISRRIFLKIAVGSSTLASSFSILGFPKVTLGQSANKVDDLVSNFFVNGRSEELILKDQETRSSLTDDEYESFVKLSGEHVKKLAGPFEADINAKVDNAIAAIKELNVISKKSSGVSIHKLSRGNLAKLIDENDKLLRKHRGRVASSGKGVGLSRPLSAPCLSYSYRAYLGWGITYPNYTNYYAAAGSPACGDVDLEITYSGYKNTLQRWNGWGSDYIAYLRVWGKIAPLRNFSGNTGMLVGGGAVNFFYYGSSYFAAASLGMS